MVSEGSNLSFIINGLINAGLRPTRQRKLLAKLVFSNGNRHFSAEEICRAVRKLRVGVSRATVYNTLNQFTQAGFLKEVVVNAGQSLFDTNLDDHYHFYHENEGALVDIP
ncbi:MAG: transcriptional repressor, partial [Rhodospirillaceae bacterium]|nr:transcriptional repressor [Rhodospirillaceae bacterium]